MNLTVERSIPFVLSPAAYLLERPRRVLKFQPGPVIKREESN